MPSLRNTVAVYTGSFLMREKPPAECMSGMHVDNEQDLKRRRITPVGMIKDEKARNGDETTAVRFMADSDTELPEAWNNNNNRELTEHDVYTELALRESELSLAKELGQALLKENAELREKYESLLDLHTSEVEDLKQEGHEYRLKCKQTQSIQDEKIHELQIDLENLQNKLQTFEAVSKNEKRVRRQNVSDLVDENAKLNSQLTKLSNSNKQLLAEISRLKQKMQKEKRSVCSCEADRAKTDALRQKLNILEEERSYLDTSINELEADKHEFSKEVDRLTQKVILLTEELADSKSELSLCEEELNSSKKENIKLHDQLEEIKLQTSQHIALSGSSIFSEISMLENEHDFSTRLAESPSRKPRQVASIHGTPKPLAASSSINLLKSQRQEHSPSDRASQSSLDESISEEEGDDRFVLKQHGFFAQLEEEQKVNMELRKEMFSVSHQLLQACKLVTNETYETKQTSTMNLEEHFMNDEAINGTLTMISAELIGLLKEYVARQNDQDKITISKEELEFQQEKLAALERQVEDLTTECFEAKKQLSSLGIQLEQSRKELAQNDEEMQQLLKKISAQQAEINSLKNKSRLLGSQSVLAELEKAKSDVKNLDAQLLAAINQKIKLSEQLEQWQYDMASVIEEQVQKQLKNTVNERDNTRRRSSLSKLSFMKKGWNWTG